MCVLNEWGEGAVFSCGRQRWRRRERGPDRRAHQKWAVSINETSWGEGLKRLSICFVRAAAAHGRGLLRRCCRRRKRHAPGHGGGGARVGAAARRGAALGAAACSHAQHLLLGVGLDGHVALGVGVAGLWGGAGGGGMRGGGQEAVRGQAGKRWEWSLQGVQIAAQRSSESGGRRATVASIEAARSASSSTAQRQQALPGRQLHPPARSRPPAGRRPGTTGPPGQSCRSPAGGRRPVMCE